MIVDASALVAIILDEPEARALAARIEQASEVHTHSVSVYEAALAVARQWRLTPGEAHAAVMTLLGEAEIAVLSIGPAETSAALDAFARYGKGRHAAALNMGDCFSYACARLRGMALLYKGEDFALTDLA